MPVPQTYRYEQVLQRMTNRVVVRTNLKDVSDSSSVRHVLAGVARELDEFYFNLDLFEQRFSLDDCRGDDLDRRAAQIDPQGVSRAPAAKASAPIVFARAGTTGTVVVPAGITIKADNGVSFVTTESATLADGSSSSTTANAAASVAGAAGNVDSGTLIRFSGKPAGVDSVSNIAKAAGGLDVQSDDDFRAAIRSYVRSLARCQTRALEFVARQAILPSGQRVVYASAVEDFFNRGNVTLYVDDGSGTAESTQAVTGENLCAGLGDPPPDSAVGGEVRLQTDLKPLKHSVVPVLTSSVRGVLTANVDWVLNDATGEFYLSTPLVTGEVITANYTAEIGLIALVQKLIDGDPSDEVNFPGWRAGGVFVRVTTPQILQQVVQATIDVLDGFTTSTVLANVSAAAQAYVNGLGIGNSVIRNVLIARMIGVPGVGNLSMTTPAADVSLLDDQLPRIVAANVLLT